MMHSSDTRLFASGKARGVTYHAAYILRKGTPVMITTLLISSLLLTVFFDHYRG